MSGLFKKNDIEKNQGNYGKAESNGRFSIDIFDVKLITFHDALASFLSTNAPANATIPNKILAVNKRRLGFGLLDASGTMNAAPNQPADKLTKSSEITTSQTVSTLTGGNVAGSLGCVNQILGRSKASSSLNGLSLSKGAVG